MTPYKEYAIKLDKAFKRARANYLEAFAELTEVKEAYDKASTSDRPEVFSGERAARIASTKANYLYAENIFKNASRNIWDDYENTVSKVGIALWQQQVVTQDTKEPTTGLIMLLV